MKNRLTYSLLLGLWFTSTASAGTIADAAALPPSSEVTINEALILSTIDLVADPGYKSFQLRDITRAITVYGTNAQIEAALSGWAAGDGINITGLTASVDGTLCLESLPPGHPLGGGSVGGFAVSGRTSSAPFPFPTSALVIGASDIGQPYESNLVRLLNVSFVAEGETFAAEANYALSGGAALVRIATTDLGLAGQPIPTGLVDITGIVIPDPAGDGYVLAPRGPGDIVLIPEPAILLILASGALLMRKK